MAELLEERIIGPIHTLTRLATMEVPDVAIFLLRTCILPKLNHLADTHGLAPWVDFSGVDAALLGLLEIVFPEHCRRNSGWRDEVALPADMGGMMIPEYVGYAVARAASTWEKEQVRAIFGDTAAEKWESAHVRSSPAAQPAIPGQALPHVDPIREWAQKIARGVDSAIGESMDEVFRTYNSFRREQNQLQGGLTVLLDTLPWDEALSHDWLSWEFAINQAYGDTAVPSPGGGPVSQRRCTDERDRNNFQARAGKIEQRFAAIVSSELPACHSGDHDAPSAS